MTAWNPWTPVHDARADQSEFTPEPHWQPPVTDENHGQTMSASRNKGQRGAAMRAAHAQNGDVQASGRGD